MSWVTLVLVLNEDVALLDRLDGESQRAGWPAHGDLVALLVADERPAHRWVDRDPPGGGIALHRSGEGVGLALALVVDAVDRRTGTGDARVRAPEHLRAP